MAGFIASPLILESPALLGGALPSGRVVQAIVTHCFQSQVSVLQKRSTAVLHGAHFLSPCLCVAFTALIVTPSLAPGKNCIEVPERSHGVLYILDLHGQPWCRWGGNEPKKWAGVRPGGNLLAHTRLSTILK